jgi:hypothetical protein
MSLIKKIASVYEENNIKPLIGFIVDGIILVALTLLVGAEFWTL